MARLDLLHEGTEIKSFSDVQAIDGSITKFQAQLSALFELLTRDDANSNKSPDSFEMSNDGAFGLAWTLESCKTIINKLFNGYFEIEPGSNRKPAMETIRAEEKPITAPDPAPPVTSDIKNNCSISNLSDAEIELSDAIDILTLLEDCHFDHLDIPIFGNNDIERLGGLVRQATTKIILTRNFLEKMNAGADQLQTKKGTA